MKALFDTNILIDHFRRDPRAKTEFARHSQHAISVVTWIEAMVGATPDTESFVRGTLGLFELVAIDQKIAETAVVIRRRYRMKLPDAIIWATAQAEGALLVTRNTKDFPADDPGVRIPYQV